MSRDDPLTPENQFASILEIDLDAIAENYRRLRSYAPTAETAGVVKADGYGLGAEAVALRLFHEGCRVFFVANLDEAMALRWVLPEAAEIAVLNGYSAGDEQSFIDHRLVPVLNDPGQVERRVADCHRLAAALPAFLHVDTGMNRLGLSAPELAKMAADGDRFDGPQWRAVMSHLACADTPAHPLNQQQLARFQDARRQLPQMPASLSNSAGVLTNSAYHFDLTRPGIALYGGEAVLDTVNPMLPTIRLLARVLQVRTVAAGDTVGYGASYTADRPRRVATIAAGYADGYLRAASNVAEVAVNGTRVPVVGRISMDMHAIDVTALTADGGGDIQAGDLVEVFGPAQWVDATADKSQTIPHEFLTRLGKRYHRRYTGKIDLGCQNGTQ